MPVQFDLEPGKPPVQFRFDVNSLHDLEAAYGANPAFLAASGRQVTALVALVQYGRVLDDPTMNARKAQKLVQRYLTAGGKVKPLMDALALAVNQSGVYGDPEDADTSEEAEA